MPHPFCRAGIWVIGILALIGAAKLGQSLTSKSAQALKSRASQRRSILQKEASEGLQHPVTSAMNGAGSAKESAMSSNQELEERLASNGNASTSSETDNPILNPLRGKVDIE